ncbi:hypothetical protein [Nonomuraea sp. B1E8]|uniref:hypothetical protein n=1 Tax=unclassified Nonomuraea TaxID=2593643 RepID=UPI00325D0FBE
MIRQLVKIGLATVAAGAVLAGATHPAQAKPYDKQTCATQAHRNTCTTKGRPVEAHRSARWVLISWGETFGKLVKIDILNARTNRVVATIQTRQPSSRNFVVVGNGEFYINVLHKNDFGYPIVAGIANYTRR